jgi:chromosome partitioning protein
MQMLVLHTPKGGSGKSTLAREIAVMSARAGVKTGLADLDPQGTTSGWYQRRQNPEPALVVFKPQNMVPQIASLYSAGFALLVMDTPPAQPRIFPSC